MLTALVGLAHVVIAAADTLALERIASNRDASVRALAASSQPGLKIGDDLAATLADLPSEDEISDPSPFIPLLSRSAKAVAQVGDIVTWRSIAFEKAGGSLTLELESGAPADLERATQALIGAGLNVQVQGSTTVQGRVIGRYVVRSS